MNLLVPGPRRMSVTHGGVVAMIVLVIVLVALVPLLVWAAMVDLKRRRRGFAPVDVETRAQALKASAEGKGTEGGAGSH